MEIINKNITQAFDDGEIDVLIHQVNCQKVMGSGVAKAIRQKYPQHYDDYMKDSPILGCSIMSVLNNQIIFGVYGQDRYGYGKRHTNYAALLEGITKAVQLIDDAVFPEEQRIGIPYNIGCGLGGWDWQIVYTLLYDLNEMIKPDGQEIILYRYNP